ncbi:discoidin domain-containing protein [Microbacterium sp. H1-D42]|uniref:discoidin domain-containing protein n=1 Tax=Microbacterium sp. H1-D42 TaxID=2925844 RepID=UPI001F5309E5|nr:discoidin domain-containing protein [Microbacterium sp. H1-D42]UNK69621.1 discoidin domain-containing protein [Microbacterium sp. H1-D42]
MATEPPVNPQVPHPPAVLRSPHNPRFLRGRWLATAAAAAVVATIAIIAPTGAAAPASAAQEQAAQAQTAATADAWWEPPNRPSPDAELNATGAPFTGTVDGEVRGLVDAHTHLNSNEGFGGRMICGAPFSPNGIAAALQDCPEHYPDGAGALFEKLTNTADTDGLHDPVGWPTFADWPDVASMSHQQSYYAWVERAWRGGQRVLVNDLVTNGVICSLPVIMPKDRSCDEMSAIRLEAQKVREMEAYIDDIYGGAGKGFFRIVTTPAQAREVIESGRLAVVLGVEMSEPFGCKMILDVAQCDRADIDAGLAEFQDLGVSSMFLCHKFDNALCGVRFDSGTQGTIINVGQFYSTGTFWSTEQCTGAMHDNPIGNATVPEIEEVLPPGVEVPQYSAGKNCNTRGLTSLGEYTLKAMMARNMMIELDHMSVKSASRSFDLIEAAGYPGVLSSHSWMDERMVDRLYRLGGFKSGYPHDAAGFVSEWQRDATARNAAGGGYGFGLDFNGVGSHPGGGTAAVPVSYPFTSADGSTVMERQVTGQRTFDINTDGFVHSGLLPDYVEQLRINGGGDAIVDDLMRGAEAYLGTWSATTAYGSQINLATGRPATASTSEWNPFTSYKPSRAVDGSDSTRWAARDWDGNPQWLQVDLGESVPVERVTVNWERAAAKAWNVQLSDDGANWRTVWSTTTGDGGLDTATFEPSSARYVRVTGTQRTTNWGYSIWELGVYAG